MSKGTVVLVVAGAATVGLAVLLITHNSKAKTKPPDNGGDNGGGNNNPPTIPTIAAIMASPNVAAVDAYKAQLMPLWNSGAIDRDGYYGLLAACDTRRIALIAVANGIPTIGDIQAITSFDALRTMYDVLAGLVNSKYITTAEYYKLTDAVSARWSQLGAA